MFTDVALRWTRPGGIIAYLTPTSVLGGQYYTALRHLLADQAPPIAIDFVHARRGVFEDVLQETLLALYRKGGKQDRFQVHYLNVDNEREARLTKNGKVGLPLDASAPWLAPREPSHVGLIKSAEGMTARLSDWGYGVSTGPLVWNRFKPQMRTRAANGLHPLIWAEAVTADGRFVFRAQKKNHAPYFKTEAGDEWLVVEKGCVLVQRTTAKEQLRRLIAAELPQTFVDAHGGVIVENHLNMVRTIAKPKVTPLPLPPCSTATWSIRCSVASAGASPCRRLNWRPSHCRLPRPWRKSSGLSRRTLRVRSSRRPCAASMASKHDAPRS